MPEKVAIVGSRDFPDAGAVRLYVAQLPKDTIIVSGGARGVDSWAVAAARDYHLEVVEFLADWDAHGRKAGPIRNAIIVREADRIVAFWDGMSRGTADTIHKARTSGKPVEIIHPRP